MIQRYFVVALVCVAMTPVAALAQDQSKSAMSESARANEPFGSTQPITTAELNTVTGKSDLGQVVQAQNNSTVSGNTVSGNSQTGTIRFDSSAFQNLSGLSLLSANTGNNVSINSSLNVNVAINR